MSNMKFSSSDGEIFEVDAEIAKCWPMISYMMDLGIDEEEEEEAFPLTTINSVVLQKVIEWSTHHKDNPPRPEESNRISSWDADFLKVDKCTLFGLIKAANFLQIKELLRVTCQKVANMMKYKTPEEIRQTFNIPNDLTAEEKEEARKNQLFEEV